jgi:hypothetical protein
LFVRARARVFCYLLPLSRLPHGTRRVSRRLQIAAKVLSSAAAAAAAGGDMSFSSDMGRERGGHDGVSMSASMPLISQLESTFQTGRRLVGCLILVLLLLLLLLLALTRKFPGTMAPLKAAASARDAAPPYFLFSV